MTLRTSTSPKLGAYAALAALGLLGGLAAGRAEPVALGAPFALVLAVGLARATPPGALMVSVALESERVLEGDDVAVAVDVASDGTFDRLEVGLVIPRGLVCRANARAFPLPHGAHHTERFVLRAPRWGNYAVGDVVVRARDRAGLFVFEARLDRRSTLRVHPRPDTLRALVRPVHTQASSGRRAARQKSAGIEFADLRPYAPGDRARDVNWRHSARRGELWVNQRHPECNTDVVLFLDAFSDEALPAAVRAAASLASSYLAEHDRLGLVSFGGVLGWVEPATGLRQHYRVFDALLATQAMFSYAWKGVATLPARTLPPRALVLAVSALEDERVLAALGDLRGRRFDVAVVEVSPEAWTTPAPGAGGVLAHRLWCLRREIARSRFRAMGMAVVGWREDMALAETLEEVGRFRRRAGQPAG